MLDKDSHGGQAGHDARERPAMAGAASCLVEVLAGSIGLARRRWAVDMIAVQLLLAAIMALGIALLYDGLLARPRSRARRGPLEGEIRRQTLTGGKYQPETPAVDEYVSPLDLAERLTLP